MSISPPRTIRSAKAAGARRLRAELTAALNDTAEDGGSRLHEIVQKLVSDARKGKLAAVREIFDRLAGKPYVGEDELPHTVLVSWKQHTPDLPAPADAEPEKHA